MTNLIKRSIYLILSFFIGLFIISSFFVRAKYNSFIYGDNPILEKQNFKILILLIIVLIIFALVLYKICLFINKYNEKIVIPISLFITLIIQLAIIFSFTKLPTADSATMLSMAINMLYKGDYSPFQVGGYLYMFPFNFSTVLYLKILLSIFPNNYLVIKFFNIMFSLITTLMIYLIYKELNYKSKKNEYGVLIFAEIFIPSLFMVNYIYNDVIATAFFTISIYFLIGFVRKVSLKYIILFALFLSIGNYFRNIGTIILIAGIIYMFLNIRNIGIKRVITAFCIVLSLFNIPNFAQNFLLQKTNIVDDSIYKNSAPIYMWLNMGINKNRFGYWDNGQSYNIYQIEGEYNKEKSTELFKEEIKDKLSNMSFSELIRMYYNKVIWIWTEGTYQIESFGLGNEAENSRNGKIMVYDHYIYNTSISNLFKEASKYRSGLLWILYVTNFLMYCFIFIRLLLQIKKRMYDEIILNLVILGFVGFYILWEIKSRYVFPVYPLLIVLSYMGFKDLYDYIFNKYNYFERRDNI